MASKSTINLTARDTEILASLIRTPLDARQILRISFSFEQPFTNDRLVRRRMSQLVDAGFVSCHQYATASVGRVNYYKPTPLGFKLVYGPAATPSREDHAVTEQLTEAGKLIGITVLEPKQSCR